MRKYGLLGEDISYSLSPKIHALIFKYFNIADASYELIDVKKENFSESIEILKKEFCGFNVTKPYKNQIVDYLSCNYSNVFSVNTCQVIDNNIAVNSHVIDKNIAVNSHVIDKNIVGYNTDVGGFKMSFAELCAKPKNMTALVLGAGGAASSVACVLKTLGVNAYFYNRTYSKAKILAESYAHKAILLDTEKISPQIIINCTTLGLNGEQSLPDAVDLSSLKYAYDAIYSPPCTPFLQKAQNCGAQIKNGYAMLIYQAILSQNIWQNLNLTPTQVYHTYNYISNNVKM